MGRSGQTTQTKSKRARRQPELLEQKIVAPQPSQQHTFTAQREQWSLLGEKLFALGGEKIVMPQFPDTDLLAILERGQVWTGKPRMRRGKPCNCHTNSAYLFEDGAGLIATGYALSSDGYWRQHSWVVGGHDGRVIETTTARDAYFGVLFSEEECFVWANKQLRG